MTTPPRTGLRRLWYVASWRTRYWWLDTRAGLVAQLLVSLAFAVVGIWSAWRGYEVGAALRAGEVPVQHAIAQWVVYAIMFVVSIIVSLALAPSIKGSAPQKVQVPVVEDGAVIRRIYGPVWIKDPIMLAFKPNGTTEIKKKAGKSWKLKTKWQVVGHHYSHFFQFGLCRGVLDAVMAVRAADKEAWAGQLTSSGIVSINKPNLWGGEDAEGGMVGDFEFAFGNPDQLPSAYLAANIAPEQSAYRWRPYATWRGGRWGNSPYPKAPAFLVSRILQGWDGQDCWYPEKAAVPLAGTEEVELVAFDSVWKYKEEGPSSTADYSAAAYDDSAWPEGPGGFGNYGPGFETPPANTIVFGGIVPTTAHNKIWIRRTVPAVPEGFMLRIEVFKDDYASLWVNGLPVTLVQDETDWFRAYAFVPAVGMAAENSLALCVEDSRGSGSPTYIYAAMRLSQVQVVNHGMNIAHALYDSLTAREMDGEPVALVNEASWRASADVLYAEGFGIGTEFIAGSETIEQFQQRLCDLAGARMSRNPTTGEWHLDLVRRGVPADVLVITDDDVLDFEEQPGLLGEAVNQVTARWTDVRLDELRATAPLQALGAIQSFGSVNAEVLECPEVLTESLALRLAARNLDARATPLKRHSLKVTRVAYKARPGTKARLVLPKRGIKDMLVVLGDISRGALRSGAIALTTVQDVAGMPDATYVIGEPGTAPSVPSVALPALDQALFEIPYRDLTEILTDADLEYLSPSAGYAGVVAKRPPGGVDYVLYTATHGAPLEEATPGGWCPTATVVEASAMDDPTGGLLRKDFTLAGASDLSSVALGSAALWSTEMVRVDALDVSSGVITLARGCGDTVPQPHAAGERIWFYDADTAIDPVERSDGAAVVAKVLSRTSGDVLDLAAAPQSEVTLASRAARPYPPGDLRINGEPFPEGIGFPATISWALRNRVLQADSVVAHDEPGPGSGEASSTTEVRVSRLSGSGWSVVDSMSTTGTSVTTTGDYTDALGVRLEVFSQRSGLRSWQSYLLEFGEPAVYDPLWADVVLSMDLRSPDGTAFSDLSSRAHGITAVGGAVKTGGETVFDGDGGYLWSADSPDWNLGAQFCIEVFGVRVPTIGADRALVSHYDAFSPASNNRAWTLNIAADGRLKFTISTTGASGTTVDYFSTGALAAGTHDIRVERCDVGGGVLQLHFYVAGALLGTPVTAPGIPFDSISYLAVGATNARGSATTRSYFLGGMKWVRLTHKARNPGASTYSVPELPLPGGAP